MKQWLAKTSDGRYKIAKLPMPHPDGDVDLTRPASGVLHTTEGSYESALSVFKQHYAPHFLVGPGKIAQLVPLGKMAAALENPAGGVETNRWARAQIEVAAHSKEAPYNFDSKTNDALASLLATLKVEAGIPLVRAYPDKMPAPPWATTKFSRRHDGRWGKTPGWYGHVEVPENAHWDPGALRWEPLLLQATHALPKPVVVKPKKLSGYWQVTTTFHDGHGRVENVKALAPWVVLQGNLLRKGVRDVHAHWVETG